MTARDLLTGLIGALLGAVAYGVVDNFGGPDAGETVESFFIGFPQDGVALTNNGQMFLAPFPEGIARFGEPALKTSMGILGKVRNTSDEVVGFASEGEDWSGEYDMTTTVGPGADGRGVIVGGTGEFENASGAFTESNHFTSFKMDGTLTTVHELKVFRKR